MQPNRPRPSPIAIVGMAARLPGGVNSLSKFWEFLVEKKNGVCDVPDTRYNIDGFYHESLPYSVRSRRGYFLDEDLAMADPSFLPVFEHESNREPGNIDPQQRLLLEVAWECLENAGQSHNYRGRNIGCYTGTFGGDWAELASKDHQQENRLYVSATGNFSLSSWLAWNLDLRGPTMTIETGCSSAMAGVHEACLSLQAGDCEAAIVAGTSLIISPTLQSHVQDAGAISTSGICRTFDAAADGYGRGEALNAILIKRLDDAIADRDCIRAVIRASAINNDGRTPHISAPSVEGQEQLIRKTYAKAGIEDVDRTAFFECHGTGTVAGDTTEAAAVARVFRRGMYLGSIKPNFGHSEGASGITSIIKVALALENKIIPPNVHFCTPNPKIPFQKASLVVPIEPTPWPDGKDERASVNNFGLGGTNVHVIMESTASVQLPDTPEPSSRSRLVVCSARSQESLHKRIDDILQYMRRFPARLHDIVYTLGVRREHMAHRAFAVSDGRVIESADMKQANGSHPPTLVFAFTGQGAQWAGMGKGLWNTFSVFRESLAKMDDALQSLPEPPVWTLQDELLCTKNLARINDAALSQPLCCALQIGLVDLLASWGITPAVVVGHSSGEVAGAYASGALTAPAAIVNAYYRGQIIHTRARRGSMIAVGLNRHEVVPYLQGDVVIACENSHSSVTLSGDHESIIEIMSVIQKNHPDVLCRQLRVEKAYHSPHMQEVSGLYEKKIAPWLPEQVPMIPMSSTVTGAILTEPGLLNSRYWRQNLDSPVLFSTAIQTILDDAPEPHIFLEIGPHSALSGPLRQILASHKNGTECVYVPSLRRHEDLVKAILDTAGTLHIQGIDRIDFEAINGPGSLLGDLPPYPWVRTRRLWNESRSVQAWRLRSVPFHELLGARTLESVNIEPCWRNMLSLVNVPWLEDHKIQGRILFPGACYVAMAGVAVQQTTSCESYQIRQLNFKAALFIENDEPVELITSMRPVRISDHAESEWFEFSITSVIGKSETKHCTGQVRPVRNTSVVSLKPSDDLGYPRRVASKSWYRALRRAGLDFGLRFRGLKDITADPTSCRATATVRTIDTVSVSPYIVHPIIIDQCLQLLSVAMCRGLGRNLTTRCIPAFLEDFYVGPTSSAEARIHASTMAREGNFIPGSMEAATSEGVFLSLTGAVLYALDDNPPGAPESIVARTVWRPAPEFLPSEVQPQSCVGTDVEFEAVQNLTFLYAAETYAGIADIDIQDKPQHLQKYSRLLRSMSDEADDRLRALSELCRRENIAVPPGAFANRKACLAATSNWRQDGQHTYANIVFSAHAVQQSCVEIFEGRRDPLQWLVEDDILPSLYRTISQFDPATESFLQRLGHSKPGLRVLEVGSGTGALTEPVLRSLQTPIGVPLYSEYTFTDISAAFFGPAQERFSASNALKYAVLDITKDPAQFGFELGAYDLVIAGNVLHGTPSLNQALQNIRALLAPGGLLMLQEICERSPLAEYVCGSLPGWWVGENDGRHDRPYVGVDRWQDEFDTAGFSKIKFISHNLSGQIATMVTQRPSAVEPSKSISMLASSSRPAPWKMAVERAFAAEGCKATWYNQTWLPPTKEDVICLLDAEGPFIHDMTEERFLTLKRFFLGRTEAITLWVTAPAQIHCQDPRYGAIHGFLRSVRVELGKSFMTMFEVDLQDASAPGHIYQVYRELCSQRELRRGNLETEYSVHDGVIHVPRIYPVDLIAELPHRPVDAHTPKQLALGQIGVLSSFYWIPKDPPSPGPTDVVVEVKFIGLNFRDVAVAHGILGAPHEIGLEGSGIISQAGSEVSNFQVGQRVAFLAPGCGGTVITVSASSLLRIPENWSLEDGATVPAVYSTIVYCLDFVGRLKAGQSVLIHSACGGVGLAAVQLCRLRGAEVYVTVGTADKVEYLVNTYQISRSRIFHSRDASFYAELMRETNQRGVDIVLNSLSGELLHVSWNCVAKQGTMIEIGKRDILSHGMLPLSPFQHGRSFVVVDLFSVGSTLGHQLLEGNVQRYMDAGDIVPVRQASCFSASEVGAAIKCMQTGNHIGKILVRMPHQSDLSGLDVKSSALPMTFSPEHSYFLAGGLGGVGRAISTWMVEQGARYFTYLSPHAGQTVEHRAFLAELAAQGCQAVAVVGQAENMQDVRTAIAQSARPVRGVIQLALDLKDSGLQEMAFPDWHAAYAPKAKGAWNLHEALEKTALDFFVLCGSLVGAVGNRRQSNYAAANTFMTALCLYRQSLGQPAGIVDLGGVADVGYLADNPPIMQYFEAQGFKLLREHDVILGLRSQLQPCTISQPSQSVISRHQLLVGLMSPRKSLEDYDDPRFHILSNMHTDDNEPNRGQSDDAGMNQFLLQVDADPSLLEQPSTEEFLVVQLGSKMSPTKADNLVALGQLPIDSLAAVEMRAWARRRLGVDVSPAEIAAAETVHGFAQLAIRALRARHSQIADSS
ncbi:ketoacyl-synt-domain-containing protein [Aspergillus candidus]|uniref:Ketoacyl-synt-domain-containing protein n=1 Tax=Aspergillus candidus TaxID=41067 RepID=A0A2I2FBM4_ASPCN|nr:ketoacyl-synt-domain-containing protein [Aspergillus candidus]PLB37997.1 ketoacyl-synt-domain-containing protein [Aspergillus candidus]